MRKNLLLLSLALLTSAGVSCSKPEKNGSASSPAPGSPTQNDSDKEAEPKKGLLKAGDLAPNFSATAHTGAKVDLAALRGKVVVLYFYPKDNTPGCTAEAQGFRDDHPALEKAGAVILGVSSQDNESHQKFAEEHGLPFLLLPDEEKKIAALYGVGTFLGYMDRVTFVIDREGKIFKVYEKVSPKNHAAEIAEDLKQLESRAP